MLRVIRTVTQQSENGVVNEVFDGNAEKVRGYGTPLSKHLYVDDDAVVEQ